jgi:hypothetical protein
MQRVSRLIVFFGFLTAGCSGIHTADKAASLALDQLARYQTDVNVKVRVETDYYDQVMENAVKRINRLRESEHDVKLKALAAAFVERHRGSDANSIEADLPDFFEAAINDWADREAGYEQLMAATHTTLTNNYKKMEAQKEKLQQLKVKLRALGEPQTTADMLRLIVAFSKEVKVEYDEMKTDTGKAADAADDATKAAAKVASK